MTRSLGQSNDDSNAVRVEIRAAEIAASRRGDPGYVHGESESAGWWDHWMGVDHLDEDPLEWLAGWLAREISTHDHRDQREATAWEWDISRPLAEQLAETAADDAAADALAPPGNEASAGTTCTCGHAVEEHGNDPEFPGSTACGECPQGDCIAFESDGAP